MDLVAVCVEGWKRFRDRQTFQTNGKIVAVLGPNEAGKTSLLRALEFLRTSGEVKQPDISRDRSADDVTIIGYFSLADDELKKAGLTVPTQLVLTKTGAGPATYTLRPEPPARDIASRKTLQGRISKALANAKFIMAIEDDLSDELENALVTLSKEEANLPESDLGKLDLVAKRLKELSFRKAPKYIQSLPVEIDALVVEERKPSTREKAHKSVKARIPRILLFGVEERDLKQAYNLDELSSSVPVALENLASVAGLDIGALIKAVDSDDAARIESLRSLANERLRKRFEEDWSQSGICVSFFVKDRLLNIIIENEPHSFTNLAERSDGFRQFAALQAFTMKQRADRPILLIDEAETHLHYDAQADLIQMLYRQEVASKVIYTTHSAGCLPEDLGVGVRIVAATSATTSKIINRFWGTAEPGFSPILIGMGASTLAFFPIRRALMVEGEAEMIVLATMVREALQRNSVGFQTVPGLSKFNKSVFPLAGTKKNHVAYLTDGDAGGRDIVKELKKHKVDEKAIFSLQVKNGSDCQLEDFVADDVLSEAVRAIVKKFNPGKNPPKLAAIPEVGKYKYLAAQFASATKKELNKVDLAYEVVELAQGGANVLDPRHRGQFAVVVTKIRKFLDPKD